MTRASNLDSEVPLYYSRSLELTRSEIARDSPALPMRR